MEQDLAYYDRLPPGREETSYDYLTDYLLTCSAVRAQFANAAVYTGFETSFAVRSVRVG